MKYNVINTNHLFTFGATFILGTAAGWLVSGQHWDTFLTSYIPSLATLVAAYYGAKFAFQFQHNKERKEEVRRNVVSGNSSIFALARMNAQLLNFQRQIIDPVRNSPARLLEMRATNQLDDDIRLNIEGLYFLLGTTDRSLLAEILAEEDKYRSAVQAINRRSHLHITEIQPQLERAGFLLGNQYSFEDINKMLGTRLFSSISHATDDVIDIVDSTVVSIKQAADKLTASLKKQYPEESIISFTFPNA